MVKSFFEVLGSVIFSGGL